MMFDEPCDGMLALYAVNDYTEGKKLRYTVKNITNGTSVYEGEFEISADSSAKAIIIPLPEKASFLYVEWETEDGICGENHFMTETRCISFKDYETAIEKVGFDEYEGF
jgi:hypothetical protein